MKLRPIALSVLIATVPAAWGLCSEGHASEREIPFSLAEEIVERGKAYENLSDFVAGGARLCGSEGAEKAVQWTKAKLEASGMDRVWLQPVRVHAWTRGTREHAEIVGPHGMPLKIAALGNSAPTPSEGLVAPVVEVQGIQELEKLGTKVRGKIVFFNRPMNSAEPNSYLAYSEAVDQRTRGATVASRLGAAAALVRSISTLQNNSHPHTGITEFESGVRPIPAAAVSTEDANRLSATLKQTRSLAVKLELDAHELPEVWSANVIGELWGRERPEEIIVVGGHLDSWDLSHGAHDDGAGVVHAIETVRALKALGVRPRRTIRTVLFMCEETGGEGGDEYARKARENQEGHLAALESDRGGFSPTGFSARDGRGRALRRLQEWAPYLAMVGADRMLTEGSGGADVDPLAELGAATFGLLPESRHYFDFHHSALDVIGNVNADELNRGAAALALLTYLLAEHGL